MGLYFKVFITLIFILRFASHSSQRTYPNTSISREDHFFALSSAPTSPSLRIIVITENGYSATLKGLLQSLADADYDRDTAALDVWMFASSTCDYVPLPAYPLAVAIFGPPRFDHSIPGVVDSINWPHGEKSLLAVRSEPDWANVWESNRGTTNETLLFIDATTTKAVSPAFYVWLKRARRATQRGMIANAAVFSLDPVRIPDGVPTTEKAVLLEQFFPATSVFSPSQDVWITFLKWYHLRTRSWFARPRIGSDLTVGGYNVVESFREYPVRAFFTEFLAIYGERVIHPVLGGNESLVLRSTGSTSSNVPGTGSNSLLRISEISEFEKNRFTGSLKDIVVPERPVLVKSNSTVSTADAPFGLTKGKLPGRTRRVTINDLVKRDASQKYNDALRRVSDFARSRGADFVSFTMTTKAFLDTTLSWLCNVVELDIVPPAIVIVTSEDSVADSLRKFIARYPRLDQGSKVVSMQGAVRAVSKASHGALHFGTSEYWMLMLQRTVLLRDLLDRGISILQFETDQIWLSDPLPYIRHELRPGRWSDAGTEDYRVPDMVVTLNRRKEVAGNFFFLRPTVGTRQMMSNVVDRFYLSYKTTRDWREARQGKFHYIPNDQSLLTVLVRRKDWEYSRRFPAVKYTVLNEELFVDGQWFLDFEDEKGRRVKRRTFYKSESSLYPVVLNNNFLVGIEAKARRARRFGFWFVVKPRDGSPPKCDSRAVRKAGRTESSRDVVTASSAKAARLSGR